MNLKIRLSRVSMLTSARSWFTASVSTSRCAIPYCD